MVEVRVTRQAVEVLGDEGDRIAVTRVDAQSAHTTDGTDEVRTSRQCIEVLAAEPGVLGVTRVDVQSVHTLDGTDEVRVSRQAVEVLGTQALTIGVSRVDVQSAHALDATTDEVRVSRQSIEILAPEGASSVVSPLALPEDAHVFLHNWARKAELTTSFRNDVTHSPDTGAESRRGLGIKPTRILELEWQVCEGTTYDELERLEVVLRRLTEGRFPVPFYMDQIELAAHVSADTIITMDTTEGRWFPGQRVAIVQLDACNQAASHTFHLIDTMDASSITLQSTLGVDVAAGSYIFPMMDGESFLNVELGLSTARVPTLQLTVIEAPGASQLPVIKSDTPTDAEIFEDAPIWDTLPNWVNAVNRGRKRHGSITSNGRVPFVDLQSDRARITHAYEVQGKRSEMWKVIEFFETRRGRLRSFWHIDEDQTFTPINIDASGTFVSVEVLGNLTDFNVEWDWVGIVMADGKVYVRDVDNIQEILTVFRLTMGSAIDTGLDINNVHRVARARRTRFESDELTETWLHTGLCQIDVSFIEVLNEADFEA